MQQKQEKIGSTYTEEEELELVHDDATRRKIFMEGSRDGIVVITEEGSVQECNLKFCEMLGYSPEETRRLHVWDWEYQYTPEEVREMLHKVDESGDHIETKHQRKDGSVFDVEINTNAAIFNGQKLVFCSCRDVSEKKKIENDLRESRELFATAFQSSPVMMTLVDINNSTYTEVNDSFCKHIGFSREELIGHTDTDTNLWVTPEDKDRLLSLLGKGPIRQEKFRFRIKTGEIRTWLCSADIITIHGKDSMLGVATDITEQEQAEQAIRESENKFSKAFQASPVVMAITAQDGTYLDVNEAFCLLTGYSHEELIGHHVSLFNFWETTEARDRMLREYKQHGHVSRMECKMRIKSGELRTTLFSAETITVKGQPCRLTVSIDITELKQAEETLWISDAAFKSIHDAVIIMDNDFIVREWNLVSEELFGIKTDDAIGKFIGELMQMQEDYPGQNNERMAVLIERGWNREEQRYTTPRGEIWVDVHAQAIEGQTTKDRHGWVTLVSDISERKKDEGKIHELYEREKALRESLEQETKKRVEFTRVLVHELKTPLTPIMATSEMLASEMTEEPWSSMARNIFRGGENLSKRIDELLDLARGEIGTLKVEPVLLHPSDYLRQITNEMVPSASTRNQSLVIEIPDNLPYLHADAQRIRQVLTNLINNAFKFTNDGGVITVKARQEQKELVVEVQDTGSGLTENEQAKLFHPYERLEADRQKLSGLGLGLALSKNLIELHGGRIWVKSKKGQGSIFGFALPIDTNRER